MEALGKLLFRYLPLKPGIALFSFLGDPIVVGPNHQQLQHAFLFCPLLGISFFWPLPLLYRRQALVDLGKLGATK